MTAPHPAAAHSHDRPANFRRNLLHFGSGLTALLVLQLSPTRGWLIGIASVLLVTAWTLEWTRRHSGRVNDTLMRILGPFAHAHERNHVNSATWYSTALFGLALFGNLMAASVAVMVLGAADPVAAQVGRRWGRHRIARNRTLEGSTAFAIAGTLISAATLAVCYPTFTAPETWLFAAVAGVAGAIAEVFSQRIDDNLSIPLVTTAAVMTAAVLL